MIVFFDKLFCSLFGWLYTKDQPCRISSGNAIKKMNYSEWQYGGKHKKTRKHMKQRKNKTQTNKYFIF